MVTAPRWDRPGAAVRTRSSSSSSIGFLDRCAGPRSSICRFNFHVWGSLVTRKYTVFRPTPVAAAVAACSEPLPSAGFVALPTLRRVGKVWKR